MESDAKGWSHLVIENYRFKFKRASDYLREEWLAFLPELPESISDGDDDDDDDDDEVELVDLQQPENTKTTVTRLEQLISDDPTSASTSTAVGTSPKEEQSEPQPQEFKTEVTQTGPYRRQCCTSTLSLPTPPSPPRSLSTSTSPLVNQFKNIRDLMAIPEEDFHIATEIVRKLHQLFIPKWPHFSAVMIRKTFLKLREISDKSGNGNVSTSDGNVAIIFCTNNTSINMSMDEIQNAILKENRGRVLFPSVREMESESGPGRSDDVERQFGGRGHYEARQFLIRGSASRFTYPFTLVRAHPVLMEAQLAKLLQYLVTFDPRCIKVLTLVRFWALTKKINLGGDNDIGHNLGLFIPPPANLDWLVMSFLVREKTVPSPREIMSREHNPVILRLRGRNFDVGFSEDSQFPEEWTQHKKSDFQAQASEEQNLISVLELTSKFFQYYGTKFKHDGWLINTRDGECHSLSSFLKSSNTTRIRTELSREEISSIKSKFEYENKSLRIDPSRNTLHILNPLHVVSTLVVDGVILRRNRVDVEMETAAKKLNAIMNKVKLGDLLGDYDLRDLSGK